MVDRVIQQAMAQELTPIYEEQFSKNSFGFRPKRGTHDALRLLFVKLDDAFIVTLNAAFGAETPQMQQII